MFPYFLPSFVLIATGVLSAPSPIPNQDCRYLPGDPQWPSGRDWIRLNTTVGGRLIASQPLARVCHDSDDAADTAACADIRSRWSEPSLYFPDPVNVMSPYWLNQSCSPFVEFTTSKPCSLGNLASYAINVSAPEHVVAGLAFARKHNIRIQVKNTGHDYLGRSTGKGSLTLWTHNLKSISFLNYTSSYYTGAAVRLGSGVQGFEAYEAAAAHGVRVVGGYCPTVGIAGGYVQGGGHGPLLSTYGLAADSTLEFEVVTVDGKHLVTSPTQHADLFWALNGGGAGNYAIIISHTTRAHQDGQVAGASLTLRHAGNDGNFWSAVAAWHRQLLVFDTIPGLTTVYRVTNDTFSLSQATFADHSASDLKSLLSPFLEEVRQLGFNYTYEVNEKPTFWGHFTTYTPKLPYGSYLNNETIGSRLISRHAVRENLPSIIEAIRDITKAPLGRFVNGVAGNVSHARVGNKHGSNAVLPAWRDALYHLIIEAWFDEASPVEVFQDIQVEMNAYQDLLQTVTPNGGTYMNEGTFDNPTWKKDYFGRNHQRLLNVKKRYDPDMVLYGSASVGSDAWTVRGDGRLCRAPGH